MGRINSLTSLRFVAAFGVLVYHFPITFSGRIGAAILSIERSGYFGVTFFFILSGFLLTTIYIDRSPLQGGSLSAFYSKRLIRILPTYYLVLAIGAFFARGQLYLAKGSGMYSQRIWDVVLHLLCLQSWVPQSSMRMHWNEPSWSVSVELAYYAVFPFLLVLIARVKDRRIPLLVLGLVLCACHSAMFYFAMIGHWNSLPSGEPSFAMNIPIFSLTTFTFGMLGALLCRQIPRSRAEPWSLMFWMGLLLVAIYIAVGVEVHPLTQLDLSLGMSLVVMGSSNIGGPVAKALAHPWLLVLGEASYALYLIQRPLDDWIAYILNRPHGGNEYNLLVIVSSLAASLAIWKLFEVPCGQWLTKRFVTPRPAK